MRVQGTQITPFGARAAFKMEQDSFYRKPNETFVIKLVQ